MENNLLRSLSRERVSEELLKGFEQSQVPSKYFKLLEETELLYVAFPEFRGCKECMHDSRGNHHNESLFQHIVEVLDRLQVSDAKFRLVVALHDIGKIQTRSEENDKVFFLEHDKVGAEIVSKRLRELRFSNDVVQYAKTLVANHMRMNKILQLCEEGQTWEKSLARLFIELGENEQLLQDMIRLSSADIRLTDSAMVEVLLAVNRWSSTTRGITGIDVLNYPKENRGKLLRQMRYIQLTQGLSRESLLKILDGEANNVH